MKVYFSDSNENFNIDTLSSNCALSSLDKYDEIIVDNKLSTDIKKEIIKHFLLSTSVKVFKNNDNEIYIISNLSSIDGTIEKADGIQYSKDILSYQDLEIEKTCRVAYELAKSNLLILDSSNKFISSRLFRKIATDINEDYPSIFRQDAFIDDLSYYLDNNYTFILTEAIHENLIVNTLLYKGYLLKKHYLTSDTQRNIYVSYNKENLQNLIN